MAKTLFWAAVIAVSIRTFAYEPFNIPSGSMQPTLLIGDYLFVSKTAYGYSRYSIPWGLAPFEGRIWEDDPERGDVIVFRPPGEPNTDFIKRLVGMPGDRVQMRGGILHINDVPVTRERVEDWIDADRPDARPVPQYIETLPGGTQHRIIEALGDNGPADNTPVFQVPADHYFMMGDNRDGSADSRALAGFMRADMDRVITEADTNLIGTVGFVPKENLIGPAQILFWSYGPEMKLYNPLTWGGALRWDRLLKIVD